MLPDSWGSDRDYETAMGTHAGPSTVSVPKKTRTGAEMVAEVRRACARALASPPKQEDDPAGLAERLWDQR